MPNEKAKQTERNSKGNGSFPSSPLGNLLHCAVGVCLQFHSQLVSQKKMVVAGRYVSSRRVICCALPVSTTVTARGSDDRL